MSARTLALVLAVSAGTGCSNACSGASAELETQWRRDRWGILSQGPPLRVGDAPAPNPALVRVTLDEARPTVGLTGPPSFVSGLDTDSSGHLAAAATTDKPGRVQLIERNTGALRREWVGGADETFSCPQFTGRPETVAFVSSRKGASELVFGTPDGIVHLRTALRPFTCPATSRDGYLAWIGTDGLVRVVNDVGDLSRAKVVSTGKDPLEVVLLSGGAVAVRSQDGNLRIGDATLKGYFHRLHDLSPNEQWILASTAAAEFKLKAVRVRDGCSVDLPALEIAGMRSLAWEVESR